MPEISIVIPTLGRSGTLAQVLGALARQTANNRDFEVVVAHDAAAAGDAARPPTELPGDLALRVLRALTPGASGARNAGWQAAAGSLVLFLDDDIRPQPVLVAEHLAWHREHPEVEAGVLGRVRWAPELRITPFMRWLDTGIQFDFDRMEGIDLPPTQFYSCNASVKRAMLHSVSGFDAEAFPFGYEDLDLAYRMAQRGFVARYNRAALADHVKSETLQSWRRNLRRIAISEMKFTERHGTRPYFHDLFSAAALGPEPTGRPARLAGFVGPKVPVVGPVVWRSYDAVCRRALAGEFLAEWEAAASSSSAT